MILDLLFAFWPVWLILIMIIAGLILIRMYWKQERLPYEKRKRLVTNSEFKFYRALQRAVGGSYTIFAMVRIADLLVVEKGTKNRRGWLNKILSKHIDFVLCDERTLEPVVGIELDDRSHQRADRIERDQFVNLAFESAGLPLLRVPTQKEYDPAEIRQLIDQEV